MNKKRKLVWLLMLTAIVMICTAAMIDAEADDDTYNFYFQKAPGPTTVNQGAAASQPKPDLTIKNGVPVEAAGTPAAAPSPAPTPATTTAAVEPLNEPSPNKWAVSLGIAGTQFNDSREKSSYGYYYGPAQHSSMMNIGHYAAGLEYNMNQYFSLLGEVFFAANVKATAASRFDYGAGLVITPLRLPMGGNYKFDIGALAGAMTVPAHIRNVYAQAQEIVHSGTPYVGLRIGVEANQKFAFQLTARRLTRYDSTHGMASVAYLF